MEFAGDRYAQLAVQGPQARATLQNLTPVDLSGIKYYWFTDGEVCGLPARIAHTGYTGEDGFEVYIDPAEAVNVWQQLVRGWRQTLRAGRAKYAAAGSEDGALRA